MRKAAHDSQKTSVKIVVAMQVSEHLEVAQQGDRTRWKVPWLTMYANTSISEGSGFILARVNGRIHCFSTHSVQNPETTLSMSTSTVRYRTRRPSQWGRIVRHRFALRGSPANLSKN